MWKWIGSWISWRWAQGEIKILNIQSFNEIPSCSFSWRRGTHWKWWWLQISGNQDKLLKLENSWFNLLSKKTIWKPTEDRKNSDSFNDACSWNYYRARSWYWLRSFVIIWIVYDPDIILWKYYFFCQLCRHRERDRNYSVK